MKLNKKSQFFFLFTILLVIIIFYLFGNKVNQKVDRYSIYKENFIKELPFVVNYAINNNLNVSLILFNYIQDYKSYLSHLTFNSNFVFFYNFANHTFVYTDVPLILKLPNGSVLNLNTTEHINVNYNYFQYIYGRISYSLNLKPMKYYLILTIY